MAKTQRQKMFDDLEQVVSKYPNMRVSATLDTFQNFMDALWRGLPPERKDRKAIIRHRTRTYRLA